MEDVKICDPRHTEAPSAKILAQANYASPDQIPAFDFRHQVRWRMNIANRLKPMRIKWRLLKNKL